jgi:hypothetical protein
MSWAWEEQVALQLVLEAEVEAKEPVVGFLRIGSLYFLLLILRYL